MTAALNFTGTLVRVDETGSEGTLRQKFRVLSAWVNVVPADNVELLES
jgi:hypothetical protein